MNQTILCFGDSNTWGYDPSTRQRYPSHLRWTTALEESLGTGYEVIPEGQPGRTTVWADPIEGNKSGKDYLLPCLESHAPLDLVIFLLGTNDLKYRFSLTATDIALGMQTLVLLTKASRARRDGAAPHILLVSPPRVKEFPGSWEAMRGAQEKSERLPELYRQVAENNACHFFDANQVISSCPQDGFHWTAESQVAFGKAIGQFIKTTLQ